jgi:hypothetical protein
MAKKNLAQQAREQVEAVQRNRQVQAAAKEQARKDAPRLAMEARTRRIKELREEGRKTMINGPYQKCLAAVQAAIAAEKTEVDVVLFRFELEWETFYATADNRPHNRRAKPRSDEYHRACGAAEAAAEKLRSIDGLTVGFIKRTTTTVPRTHTDPDFFDVSHYGDPIRKVSTYDDTEPLLSGTEYVGVWDGFSIDNKDCLEVRISF